MPETMPSSLSGAIGKADRQGMDGNVEKEKEQCTAASISHPRAKQSPTIGCASQTRGASVSEYTLYPGAACR